jgi:hypothetical protein
MRRGVLDSTGSGYDPIIGAALSGRSSRKEIFVQDNKKFI